MFLTAGACDLFVPLCTPANWQPHNLPPHPACHCFMPFTNITIIGATSHVTEVSPTKTFNMLASTLALPPDLRQKVEGFFNGLKRGSATIHSRKRMVGLDNFHWMDTPTSMVQLPRFHGSAFALPSISFKSPLLPPKIPTCHHSADRPRNVQIEGVSQSVMVQTLFGHIAITHPATINTINTHTFTLSHFQTFIIARNEFCVETAKLQLWNKKMSLPLWKLAVTKPKSALPFLNLALTLPLIGTDTSPI